MLQELRDKLSPSAQRYRQTAFQLAERYIQRVAAAGGVQAPLAKSFPEPSRSDGSRVDIEVHKGTAFVNDPVVTRTSTIERADG